MKADDSVINIDTIEELTVHALDRTEEGITQLCDDCRKCATAFSDGADTKLATLSELAHNLRDFDVFQNDLVSLFQLDTESMADGTGTLKAAEEEFHRALNELLARIGDADSPGISNLLEKDLPDSLERYKALMAVVRDYVHAEYLCPA